VALTFHVTVSGTPWLKVKRSVACCSIGRSAPCELATSNVLICGSGAAWSAPVRLSDQGSGAPYKNPNGYAFPHGDYFEIAVDVTGTAHVLWGEGTNYDGPGGTWYTRGK
jgi:hypothetical protein